MAYNAYDPKHIRFVDCHFEDCAGDYVRFRDGTDFGVVVGCTFKSTGNYRNVNMPFISKPKGWTGMVDITDTINSREVVETAERAMKFFE